MVDPIRCGALILVTACAPKTDRAPETCPPVQGAQLAVATTDYSTGVLANVDLETDCVSDLLSTRLGGDPIAVTAGAYVAVVLRSDADVIRLYEPGSWDEPVIEVAVEPGSNIHDVAIVGDLLFATPYERAAIDVYDLAVGTWLSGIDLSAYADDDGIPEADRFWVTDDHLLAALQRLDRNEQPWSAHPGKVLTIDPEALTVIAEIEVGPNPKLFGDRVLTGVYGQLDGALGGLNGEVFLTEADEGFDFALYGERDGLELLVGSNFDGETQIRCSAGTWIEGESTDAWVSDLVMIGDGRAVLATRSGWATDVVGGLMTLDLRSCSFVGDLVPLALEPYSVALVE